MVGLVVAEDLGKRYRMGEETIHALNGVSFQIDAGDYVAIIGPSGSGKSTLMNLLGGLDRPSSGTLSIGGSDLGRMDDQDLAGFRNTSIGFVFQSFNLLPRLTALQNIELPLIYAGRKRKERRTRAQELLTSVGLGQRMDHRPTQLSGGQQQRVAIARALACEPAILLADEPTGALDTATSQDIMALFQSLNRQGATIILVTHEADVAACARRVIEMRDGKIVADRLNGGGP